MPNFICSGAPKSGTTTLYDILKDHPDIFLPTFKEPHFFNDNVSCLKGLEWYSKTYFSGYTHQKIIGDFTPTYLISQEAPQRIFNSLGKNVKFLFILRQPGDRAYSHFMHNKRDQIEELGFEEALMNEEKRMRQFTRENNFISAIKYSYINQSLYSSHVKKYREVFGKDNVMVLIFEQFFSNIDLYMHQVLDFLAIDKNVNLELDKKSNPGGIARSKALKSSIRRDSLLKRFLKKIIPWAATRKKLTNFIHSVNNKPQDYDKPGKEFKIKIINRFFCMIL